MQKTALSESQQQEAAGSAIPRNTKKKSAGKNPAAYCVGQLALWSGTGRYEQRDGEERLGVAGHEASKGRSLSVRRADKERGRAGGAREHRSS